ncbi:MAG: TetR/AcrR family transcriptional regulator C-terminal domain-containing protein [Terrimicrobiaceae bacterium]
MSKPKSKGAGRSRTAEPLTPSRVTSEAVAMADESGLEALSMRGLAERLGVEAMSLYNHVPNKESLIDAMVDHVTGEILLPRVDRAWRPQMRQRALSAVGVLMQHPWAAMPMLSRMNTGPCMLTYIDRTHGCLLAAGFSHRGADWARHLMDSHIYGFALQELHFPIPSADFSTTAAAFLPRIPAEHYPHFRGLAEQVISGKYDGRNSFKFGMEIILEGLARKSKSVGLIQAFGR